MKPEQSLTIMKALADQSRLAIISSLLEHPQYVEEIARRHGLAPSTVSFHLRKLEQAGLVRSRKDQYYTIFQANHSVFDTTLRQVVSATPVARDLQDQRMDDYRRKVLDTFFHNGRLEKLPAQHKKRLIVLEQFSRRFEAKRPYSEQEVTGLILPLFDDYCTIRRLLVDEGLLRRNGTSYWREQEGQVAADVSPPPPTSTLKDAGQMNDQTRRNDIKRTYKQNAPDMGVFQIRCRANGKLYVASSRNLDGERNSRLFQLRMGKFSSSRDLQQDLERLGGDQFEFSVLEVLDRRFSGNQALQRLAVLETGWVEKLQPFGERGYNSPRKHQRNRDRLQQLS